MSIKHPAYIVISAPQPKHQNRAGVEHLGDIGQAKIEGGYFFVAWPKPSEDEAREARDCAERLQRANPSRVFYAAKILDPSEDVEKLIEATVESLRSRNIPVSPRRMFRIRVESALRCANRAMSAREVASLPVIFGCLSMGAGPLEVAMVKRSLLRLCRDGRAVVDSSVWDRAVAVDDFLAGEKAPTKFRYLNT